MKEALKAIIEDENAFIWIGGKAGTGKSTFLQHIKTNIRPENTVYLAPTGIAALLIGGATIHSFFLIKPEPIYLPITYDKEFRNRLFPKLKKTNLIIIDEISMVRADLLDEIDRRMRAAKKRGGCSIRRSPCGCVRRSIPVTSRHGYGQFNTGDVSWYLSEPVLLFVADHERIVQKHEIYRIH
ncbi:MAG: AAA family ATPase [Candidatus Competibacteraceae bacterium]|nr:AAA family ATPase [Candidatus Competibacteraceae bacterium]